MILEEVTDKDIKIVLMRALDDWLDSNVPDFDHNDYRIRQLRANFIILHRVNGRENK